MTEYEFSRVIEITIALMGIIFYYSIVFKIYDNWRKCLKHEFSLHSVLLGLVPLTLIYMGSTLIVQCFGHIKEF